MTTIQQRREQMQKDYERLDKQFREMMQGRFVPSTRALSVQRKMFSVRDEIKRLDREASERLALERAPIDEVLEVIAIPLLADVLNDLVASVDATLRRHGAQETIFSTYTAQIRRAALAMVDTLSMGEENLPRLLDVDDTLVDAIRKKLMSFIKQRLKIKNN